MGRIRKCGFLEIIRKACLQRGRIGPPYAKKRKSRTLRLRCPIVQCETRWYLGNIHGGESNRQELLTVEKF